MGDVSEASGICAAIGAKETFEAIAAIDITDAKATFSHLLVQVCTGIRWCVLSHERCKGGARARSGRPALTSEGCRDLPSWAKATQQVASEQPSEPTKPSKQSKPLKQSLPPKPLTPSPCSTTWPCRSTHGFCWCVSSHELCKCGAQARACRTCTFQSVGVVNRLRAGDAWTPGISALDQRACPRTGRTELCL